MNSPYLDTAQSQNLVSNITYNPIQEMDPSLNNNLEIVFDQEITMELRPQSQSTVHGQQEAIKVKVLRNTDMHLMTQIELSSERDLFFHYIFTVDERTWTHLSEAQGLRIDFSEFAETVVKAFEQIIENPELKHAIFLISDDCTHGRLDIVQNMDFKFVELMSLNFEVSNEDNIREQITFRYNSLKAQMHLLQNRLREINDMLKGHPSLLRQIRKRVLALPTKKI
eukprot:TRINITY_DN3171_c3_g4_i1.p1 TRINITY_DN3171_c3_g4~~TRINITY_DN3171_c3_g4_i1.p1  ORF type:complete len:225 (-),score=65.71 TRINITY_DN3171_c3_g4_i1:122-796(-)